MRVSRVPRSILIVAPEFAIDADGTYRPGGLAVFARSVVEALTGAPGLARLEAWGLLDTPAGLGVFERHHRGSPTRVRARAFGGDRPRMAVEFALRHLAFELVIFLHIGVGRLGVLRPFRRQSLWLVGIEVRRRLRADERFTVRRARPLLAISRFSSDEMRRHNPDLPAALPVHLAVEPEGPWSSSPTTHATATVVPPVVPPYVAAARRPAVLIVARLAASERYKGHDQLLEAWTEVRRQHPAAELWIAGAGDDLERLRGKAADLGHAGGDSIQFLGRVSHARLFELYATARLFAMPSTGEGFGLVFTEAMRFGLPCVCSFDSSAEIVQDGVTGLVVAQEPAAIAAACSRLLADDALAERLGAAGQQRFREHYTFDRMRARVRAAYGYVTSASTSPTAETRP
jgi:phosphatidylinositol alpha-1,6-mannosyltransferase